MVSVPKGFDTVQFCGWILTFGENMTAFTFRFDELDPSLTLDSQDYTLVNTDHTLSHSVQLKTEQYFALN